MGEFSAAKHQLERWFTEDVVKTIEDLRNPRQGWRRLVAEMG